MKLTNLQYEIVRRMKEGWELGEEINSFSPRAFLQKGGIGRGGSMHYISRATVKALVKRNIVKSVKQDFPYRYYALVESSLDEIE